MVGWHAIYVAVGLHLSKKAIDLVFSKLKQEILIVVALKVQTIVPFVVVKRPF